MIVRSFIGVIIEWNNNGITTTREDGRLVTEMRTTSLCDKQDCNSFSWSCENLLSTRGHAYHGFNCLHCLIQDIAFLVFFARNLREKQQVQRHTFILKTLMLPCDCCIYHGIRPRSAKKQCMTYAYYTPKDIIFQDDVCLSSMIPPVLPPVLNHPFHWLFAQD